MSKIKSGRKKTRVHRLSATGAGILAKLVTFVRSGTGFGISRKNMQGQNNGQRKAVCALEMINSCLNEARLPSWWRSSHKRRRRSQKLLQRAEKSPFLECLHSHSQGCALQLDAATLLDTGGDSTSRAPPQFLVSQRHRSGARLPFSAP